MLCLIETVSTTQIPNALASTKESFGKFMQGQLVADGYKSAGLKRVLQGSKKEFANLKGGLMMILAIGEMMNSSSFKSKICKQNMIQVLAYLFENCEFQKNNKTLEEFRTCLF